MQFTWELKAVEVDLNDAFCEEKGMRFDFDDDKFDCDGSKCVWLTDKDNIRHFKRAYECQDEYCPYGMYKIVRERFDGAIQVICPTACFTGNERVSGNVPKSYEDLLKLVDEWGESTLDKKVNEETKCYPPYDYFAGCNDVFEWMANILQSMIKQEKPNT